MGWGYGCTFFFFTEITYERNTDKRERTVKLIKWQYLGSTIKSHVLPSIQFNRID